MRTTSSTQLPKGHQLNHVEKPDNVSIPSSTASQFQLCVEKLYIIVKGFLRSLKKVTMISTERYLFFLPKVRFRGWMKL